MLRLVMSLESERARGLSRHGSLPPEIQGFQDRLAQARIRRHPALQAMFDTRYSRAIDIDHRQRLHTVGMIRVGSRSESLGRKNSFPILLACLFLCVFFLHLCA